MLQIQHICKEYRTGTLVQKALDDVSLSLRDNEFVAILGPSGSGKTTLLNIIGGLDRYDRGDLIINGISTKKYKDRDWDSYRNHTIGFVFQSFNLLPKQTALDNVALPLSYAGVPVKKRKEIAFQALKRVGLAERVHFRPSQLSGGQQQRVAIARALAMHPKMLFFDEPTSALDPEITAGILKLLRALADEKMTMVIVTHEIAFARNVADRVIFMDGGVIVEEGKPEDVIDNPKSERTKAFLQKMA